MQFLNYSQTGLEIRRQRTSLQAVMASGCWQGEIVQIAPFKGDDLIDTVSFGACGLTHVRFPHEAAVHLQQPKGFVTFTLPVAGTQRLWVNGVATHPQGLFINFGCDETHTYGMGRNLIAGRIETGAFLAALGEVTCSTPEEDVIPRGLLILEPVLRERLVELLLTCIHSRTDLTGNAAPLESFVIAALAHAVSSARNAGVTSARALKVFERARIRIGQSVDHRPALSEISDAAGYSVPVVNDAFRGVVGLSPSRYARHLSLARAHRTLFQAKPENASVKAIALETGFTEGGRFSGLYKQVYGELPSETLRL